MLLEKLQNSSRTIVPAATALIVVGLMLVMVSASWSRLVAAGSGGNDFARGFLIGFGIVLKISGVVLLAKAASRRIGKT
jgi:hypothetical protein